MRTRYHNRTPPSNRRSGAFSSSISQQPLGSLADLGQGELDPPDLSFVLKSILAYQLQLLVEVGFLEESQQSHSGFATNPSLGPQHVGSLVAEKELFYISYNAQVFWQ